MDFNKELKKALEDYETSLVDHYEGLAHPERRRPVKNKRLYFGFGGLAIAVVLLVFAILPAMKASAPDQYVADSYDAVREEMGYDVPSEAIAEEMVEEAEGDYGTEDSMVLGDQKIIRTFHLDMETKNLASAMEEVEKLVTSHGGYIEDSSYSGKLEEGEYAYAYYTLRIPKGKLEDIRSSLEGVGQIHNFSQSAEDVTRVYRDTESRIELLKLKEDKLKELLEKAEDLEDIITIESQLMDLQYEREYITGELRYLDDRIDYDTYHVSIEQVRTFTEKSFGQRFKDSFGLGLRNFARSMEDLIVSLAYNWVYIILLLLLAFGVYKFVSSRRKKKL